MTIRTEEVLESNRVHVRMINGVGRWSRLLDENGVPVDILPDLERLAGKNLGESLWRADEAFAHWHVDRETLVHPDIEDAIYRAV